MILGVFGATGNVKTTWTFSAFTVLVYDAVTHAAALRLPVDRRLYSRWWTLAFAVEWRVWLAGAGLLAIGLARHGVRRH